MQIFRTTGSCSIAKLGLTLIVCFGLVACSSSGSGDGDTAIADTQTDNTQDNSDATDGTGSIDEGTDNTVDNNTDPSDGSADEEFLTAVNISTDLQPSFDDTGTDYELLGYRLAFGNILAMDVLATNRSDVIKSMGNCSASVFNGDQPVEFTDSTFISGAPLRPGDEMVTTLFFRDVSDPSAVDRVVADCNYTDLVNTGNDPAVTYDFIEFTGPDTLGRILVNVQNNNDSGNTIDFSRCDFSARNGNRIVENARVDFNFGREILPGEAFLGEGFLILDFDEFESDTFDPADLHCDYLPVS